MDSDADSLISKLDSSDIINIHRLFSDYLHPFTDLISPKPKKTKKPSNTLGQDHSSTLRSLSKKYLPVLNRALSLIPKRLSKTPKLDEQLGLQLFDTYKLCLNCLDCISSQLSGKPYSVHLQRVRLMHCFEGWGRYKDAESEGYLMLDNLRGMEVGVSGSKKAKPQKRLLPDFKGENVDSEFTYLVVDIVVTLVKCTFMNQTKDEGDYRRVLSLVDEVTPWFSVLDANAYEKLHRVLVKYIGKYTLLLVGNLMSFGGDLVRRFCLLIFDEYRRSSMKDQMQKFACEICSSIVSQYDNKSSSVIDLLMCVLDTMAGECKVEEESTAMVFLEFVYYCADQCQTATTNLCHSIATHLNKIAVDIFQGLSPIDLILGLYSTGLFINDCNSQSRQGDSTTTRNMKDRSMIDFLLDNEDRLQHLTALLGLLKSHFHTSGKENSLPFSTEVKNYVHRVHSKIEANYEGSGVFTHKIGKSYMLSYYNALKYLCQQLAKFVNSTRKEIVGETEGASFSAVLCDIQDALHQFCDVFLFHHSAFEKRRDACDDNDKTVLSVAVAAFTLSFRTKHNVKESATFIKHVIACNWIQPHGLKFLFVSLHNVGTILYRNKQLNEASKVLKLSCRASWICVSHLRDMFVNKSNRPHSDKTEDAIVDFVREACTESALLLDVLYQCGSHKVNRIIGDSLENWSVAEILVERLPSPIALVKQWVKINCKLCKDVDVEHGATTIHSLLSSSLKVSKRTLGILLEQELLAYKEMNSLNPVFCQRMKMEIIDILLGEVYVTNDSCLQKSRILIAKARELRATGVEGLNGCIQCLSEAISAMKDMYGENCSLSVPVRHQLAVAYCFRALCTQEAEPNSKRIFEDLHEALSLWLSPDHCNADDHCNIASENMLTLLYHVVDLLSMKGFTEFHSDIYELIIRLFKWKNVPLEKCLATLWEYRRLGHALCASPVNEAFILILSQHCGELSKSIDFWISCMKGSWPLQMGFQQNFSFMFTIFSQGSYNHESSFRSDTTVEEVKQAALGLISTVPQPTGSVFVAAHLYYDLCGRLTSNGRLMEALSCAKEAHRLRSQLLKEKFMFSGEQQNNNGYTIQKPRYSLSTFHLYSSVATAIWSNSNSSFDLEASILTPWNVLQCYLESTLQVGIIHEMIGNGSEAEAFLLWGKDISCYQGLPFLIVAFSSVLGRLYRKQKLWELADKELQTAKQILADSCTGISCLKCRVVLEVNIDQELGDLFRSQFDSDTCDPFLRKLYDSENLYKSALEKLNISEWKNSVSNPEETNTGSTATLDALVKEVRHGVNNSFSHRINQSDIGAFPTIGEGPEIDMETKKCRKTKRAPKPFPQEQCLISEHNSRMTRSRYRSSQENSESIPDKVQTGLTKHLDSEHIFGCPDALRQRGPLSEIKCSTTNCGGELTCVCNKLKCWYCFPREVIESGSINSLIHIKWEFIRRQLTLRLLTSIGKCLGIRGEIHEAHEILMQGISTLVSRNPFCPINSSVPFTFLLDLIGKDIPGDAFTVQHAVILYNISWLTVKSYPCQRTRINCCDLSNIQIQRIVSWLMLSFVLCREVPILFQKVSRLLATLYILSSSCEPFSLSSSTSKALSVSHWASYFHQASLGTHHNHQLCSNIIGKHRVEGSCLRGSSINSDIHNSLRLAPESLEELEGSVLNFFKGLPCSTVICISLLGGAYTNLLRELLFYPSSSVHAWILLSRLNSSSQPVVILLPVDSVLEEASDEDGNSDSSNLFEGKHFEKQWHCPWGSTVVDDIAPGFRLILEENYSSSSTSFLEDSKKNRSLWWMWRKRLDQRLGKFLRVLEDTWFGPWKFLLLGEWSECRHLDSVQKKLVHDLKYKYKMDVQDSLLKVILEGAKYTCENEECVLQLILNQGCYVGVGYERGRCGTSSRVHDGVESQSHMIFKRIFEAANEVEVCEDREPVILVLDSEVQMLPWENLPLLRSQEVYRMPSVGCISATLDRCLHRKEQVGRNAVVFPLIDPLDAFYLLNPSGDLSSTQVEFEKWFKDQNLEGKAGTAPTVEELAVALKSHDLFIYFGHGSGAQYIPGHEIQKVENCAATLLMGCSSGSLSLNGCYTPQGAPLYYLLAGSPVIVANLWEVTDKDIDRFAKAMLDGCVRERASASLDCPRCNLLAKEFKSMHISRTKGNAQKKTSRKKLLEYCDIINTCNDCCSHRPKIGSFMFQAREACTLPFLTGASPVCYGIPTGIQKKKDL
ncbi:separase [Cornus florida]|uniref:separase n=1 Tax=Cornus florida TaxID=4283 RepID=UPI0028A29D6E|nr:separase [Cornus florida]